MKLPDHRTADESRIFHDHLWSRLAKWNYTLLLTVFLAFATITAHADTPNVAFPGAEGAGKYATGGRGGEVYHVTNLSDFGAGSLRHAIESADNPRTIVFEVAGTIYLSDRLQARGKSNLTIAGQTAPGTGITIANRSFFIRDSDNIIVQNIRFAPGDGLTKPGTEDLPGHMPGGNPRSIRVWGSQDVIVDHVTARWGQEDNMGISHGSERVTIQNTYAAEGLHDADHNKGRRGYAMVINGPHLSVLGNLLTQHGSRNPRAGLDGTLFEFSNNVIYNPGGWAAAFTDELQNNFTGNIGITGTSPQHPQALITGGDYSAQVYAEDNFYDQNSNETLNLNGESGQIVGTPRRVVSPFDIQSDYEPRSTRAAYIHLLSRGGASITRDLHDKRAVRDVVERGGRHIDRPVDVGGYLDYETGHTIISTARDGIADWWKEARGLDVNTRYNTVFADDGYTLLEHYLHDLMDKVRIPDDAEEISIAADEWPETEWPDVSNGNGYHMLRFDLSNIRPGSIVDASLTLDGVSTGVSVLARDPMVSADDWNPGNSTIPVEMYSKSPWSIGKLFEDNLFNSPNLAVYLNNAQLHFPDSDDRNIITLLIEGNGDNFAEITPQLVLQAALRPALESIELSAPEHRSEVYSSTVTLEWHGSEDVESYHLQVANDPVFSSPIIDETDLEQTSYEFDGLDLENQYYWRVRSVSDGQTSDWSSPWSFVHAMETSTEFADTPIEYQLNQNYPNPFNPVTQISFAMPESGQVTIEVYAITGQRVATLVNEQREAGRHTVAFDGSHLASGVYTYRMQTDNFVKTRKFTLLK